MFFAGGDIRNMQIQSLCVCVWGGGGGGGIVVKPVKKNGHFGRKIMKLSEQMLIMLSKMWPLATYINQPYYQYTFQISDHCSKKNELGQALI
jgi:hypothetical protein